MISLEKQVLNSLAISANVIFIKTLFYNSFIIAFEYSGGVFVSIFCKHETQILQHTSE